jgi:hypothetical protein
MATSKSFTSPIPQREKYANTKRPIALKKKKESEESAHPSISTTVKRVRTNRFGIRLYFISKQAMTKRIREEVTQSRYRRM